MPTVDNMKYILFIMTMKNFSICIKIIVKPISVGSGTDKLIQRTESRAPKPTPDMQHLDICQSLPCRSLGEGELFIQLKY